MVDMHSESLRGTCAARTSVVLDRLDEASTGQFRQSYASAAKSSLAGAVGLRLDSPSTDGVAVHVLLGSPDPHGLQLTERSAPVRKKPMYGSLAHAEAEEEELMGRPFAHLNVPPPTPPHDPPEPTAGLPPSVDSIEQILPRHTRAIVNAWRRRLRRCLRYAAAGDVQMARRLRPKDLWLPAEYHMEPEARAYDWDLRPLARGEAAIPWEISGRDGVRPASALDAKAVLSGADGFADEGIVSEMLSGIEDDACCERGSLLCAPHASALAHWAVAAERTQRNVKQGWAFEADLPCWPIRACPYGLVDESERAGKIKWRLTNDLSWPPPGTLDDGSGGYVSSLNDSMDRRRWPPCRLMRVSEFAESAAVMRATGAPVALWGLDCAAFYRTMGRQRAQIWRNAMAVNGGFQVDERCCFGSAADAVKCSRVSNFLAFHLRKALDDVDQRYPSRDPRVLRWLERRAAAAAEAAADAADFVRCSQTGIYIDDITACSFADEVCDAAGVPLRRNGRPVTRAQLHFEAAKRVLESFGFASEPTKEQPPSYRLVSLGVELDVDEGWMRLDGAKRLRYLKRVRLALNATSMARAEYLQLLGRLQFAATCFPKARQWLNAAWRVARARFRLADGRVPITSKVKSDLRRWEEALGAAVVPNVPLATVRSVRPVGEPGAGAIYADASGSMGWGAWTLLGDEVLVVVGEWSAKELELGIAEKELFASTAGLVTLVNETGWTDVTSFTDNMVALAAMRSCTPSTPRLQALVEARLDWMSRTGVLEAAERVGSKSNLWADLASRRRLCDVLRQAEDLGLRTRVVPAAKHWDSAAWLLGVDAA